MRLKRKKRKEKGKEKGKKKEGERKEKGRRKERKRKEKGRKRGKKRKEKAREKRQRKKREGCFLRLRRKSMPSRKAILLALPNWNGSQNQSSQSLILFTAKKTTNFEFNFVLATKMSFSFFLLSFFILEVNFFSATRSQSKKKEDLSSDFLDRSKQKKKKKATLLASFQMSPGRPSDSFFLSFSLSLFLSFALSFFFSVFLSL